MLQRKEPHREKMPLVSLSRHGKITIIDPGGDIRVRMLLTLRPILEQICEQTPAAVALDLRKVSFIDSSGVGLITNLSKRLNAIGAKLYIFGCNPDLKELLDMVGLQDSAHFCRHMNEVVAAANGNRL